MSLFLALNPSAPDPVFQLTAKYRADPRAQKLDLGVGVFKDVNGRTPVMKAVQQAQALLFETEASKAYEGLSGYAPFNEECIRLVFGDDTDAQRFAALQTPGGAAAVRLLAELTKLARPDATVWISEETWAPHFTIVSAAGLKWKTYRHYDRERGLADFESLTNDLQGAKSGDVILLHGCCQNPTGADLSEQEWNELADILLERNLIPFLDIAYQGFGAGLKEDALSARILARKLPELMLAYSFSKNFGVYRDRVGCAVVMSKDGPAVRLAVESLVVVARGLYSMPPHHGAAVVAEILRSASLKTVWEEELEIMRIQVKETRRTFAEELRTRLGDERFDFMEGQNGMFSLLPVSRDAVELLQERHAIYMPGNGRINLAGMSGPATRQVADALADVIRK
ncbi:aromatic amino acid transaminase (plasmid) [Rhizobium sp. 32-5/1]|uniref:amino acid aminotransferase n=1 Tax=Rhizobium sp. 32-5/1 TaxID=3019602 RepID=UPI00240E6CA0|nr:aromatic amino acid transaminase [Rhizobium sp. 32-5/1]WEZ85355.1 aromatic amino acid transaminase [Rhizobium sp. 32-5/1]